MSGMLFKRQSIRAVIPVLFRQSYSLQADNKISILARKKDNPNNIMSKYSGGLIPSGNDINLQLGWPSPSLFPSSLINTSTTTILSDFATASSSLIYGPSLGGAAFRTALSSWLSNHYYRKPDMIASTRVCVTSGGSAALGAVLSRFTDPDFTQYIWMVEPTYFLACPIFQDAGFTGRLKGVPEDEEGVDLEFLRAGLERARSEDTKAIPKKCPETGYPKIYKHVIYCVPTFSNPSGKTMSLSHREKLVRLAREFDALVVSDDVYDFLRWPEDQSIDLATDLGPLPPRLVDIDRALEGTNLFGNTVSNGSFSKIVAPGTRVGWAEGTEDFVAAMAKVGVTSSGGCPSHLMSCFMGDMISTGALDKHINETLIPTYSSRYHAMMSAIQTSLIPLGVKITVGKPFRSGGPEIQFAGGFFTSLSIPEHLPPTSVLAALALEKKGLRFAYGQMFEVVGDSGSHERANSQGGFGHSLRLCWAWHEEDNIRDGVERLAEALKELMETSNGVQAD
ncbi:PLP-dependent transferase [Mollisia scopiformis]|uniref:PLP-dependent transferase n=1 Tax=Mollisia scopiformis TaxID=149040 RepID=A0A194XCQ0_MOLSC|nr:PLP-dependent transferase [Mollisia scopiformis]KUJ17532.1 PLP-dependent transferase [Mollisia scopiformis]